MPGLKDELHRNLRASREALVSRLEGLGEYDLRRPMTPSATNLLGLVKHLAGLEYAYLGASFGRPAPEALPWVEDGSVWRNADMWATQAQSSAYVIGLYQRACGHSDLTIAELSLDTAGSVAHWPEGQRATTLAAALVLMIAETAQHAGHADIVRELIDGKAGADQHEVLDEASWRRYVADVDAASEMFAPVAPGGG